MELNLHVVSEMLSFEVPLPPVDPHMCKIKCEPRGTEHLNRMCKIAKGSFFEKNSSYNSVKVFLTIEMDFQDTGKENSSCMERGFFVIQVLIQMTFESKEWSMLKSGILGRGRRTT